MSSFSTIEKFINSIIATYENCDRETLKELWRNANAVKSNGCVFEITRGAKKGEQCGKTVTKDCQYCSRHQKSTSKSTEDASKPKERRMSKPREASKSRSRSSSPERKELGTRILRRHSLLDVLYHSETNLVFDSAVNRVVTGIIKDDKICELDKEDIDTAKKWSFQVKNESQ